MSQECHELTFAVEMAGLTEPAPNELRNDALMTINGPLREGHSMGNIVTRFTERFGCKHPFACAGMAFAGMTPDLELAVCRGGGVGAIGVGLTSAEQLR